MTLDTTHMDLADLEGSLSDLPEEMKFALATSLLGQYMGSQHPDDAFLIIRTREADLADHHDTHHRMALAVLGVGGGFRNMLSSLHYRSGVDNKLGWYEAGRKTVRKTLSRTAGAFGHSIN